MRHPLLMLVALAFPPFGYIAARVGLILGKLSHPNVPKSINTRLLWGFVVFFTLVGLGVGVVLSTR